jgi:hypothetical protein
VAVANAEKLIKIKEKRKEKQRRDKIKGEQKN